MLAKMWSKQKSHMLFLEMKNSITTLEKDLLVAYKGKHILHDPAVLLIYLLLYPNESICSSSSLPFYIEF